MSQTAMDINWSPKDCLGLSIAKCAVHLYNPQIVVLMLNDGDGQDPVKFEAGNTALIQHIRDFPESNVRLFVVVGPPTMNVGNPYGSGVVVVDLKDAVERALQNGIRLMGDDGFHLRPVDDPYEESWQLEWARAWFRDLVAGAIMQGGGVYYMAGNYIETHPYVPADAPQSP